MSALFQNEPGNFLQSMSTNRKLEIRQVPRIDQTEYTTLDPDSGTLWASGILNNLYTNLSTNWMYTATIQITLNGSQPPWSRDGWSFVPIELSSLKNFSSVQNTGAGAHQGYLASPSPETNISLTTPAIRGRIECSPYETLNNLSSWLTTVDPTNSSIWNLTASPTGVSEGYELGSPPPWMTFESSKTPILNNPSFLTCCGNETDQSARGVAVGYWSPNYKLNASWPFEYFPFVGQQWPRNFTTKFIRGQAVTGFISKLDFTSHMIFTEVPSVQALNCMPIIETATANVTVDQATGLVKSFVILDKPTPASQAWADPFVLRGVLNISESNFAVLTNVTTR
jgi:hypothetical protein